MNVSGIGADLLPQPSETEPRRFHPQKIPATPQFVKGQVLIKYNEEFLPPKNVPDNASERARAVEDIGRRLSLKYRVDVLMTHPRTAIQLLRLPPGLSVTAIIEKLKNDPMVEFVGPNYKIYALTHNTNPPPPDDPKWAVDHMPAPTGHALASFSALWGMETIGMKQAWNINKGDENIIIAVLDSGIDYHHRDLASNLWTNPSNGSHGVNFLWGIANDCVAVQREDVLDDEGHGTHVAGTIAARGNNNTDVIGVNWRASLMALKVLCMDTDGFISGSVGATIGAIQYAADNGARVMNASLATGELDPDVQDIFRIAIEDANDKNALLVAAAGNEAVDISTFPNKFFPANYVLDNVMSVAATTWNDDLWSNSNFGVKVHIASPGWSILSTLPGNTTGWNDGTSMAAPHVAGCAALLLARRLSMGASSPILPKDLRALIMSSGDQPVNAFGNQTLDGKVHEARRLNCYNAMAPHDVTPPAAPTGLKIQ